MTQTPYTAHSAQRAPPVCPHIARYNKMIQLHIIYIMYNRMGTPRQPGNRATYRVLEFLLSFLSTLYA